MKKNKRALIVGSGPAGATVGRKLAESGWHVQIHEKRSHIGGNLYDYKDKNGVLIHKYGPHYFRANNYKLIQWLSNYTKWHTGNYYVKAKVGKKLVPLPISLSTISTLKGEIYNEKTFKEYLAKNRVNIPNPKNCEEQCLSLVGQELYEAIFKGYTLKQWNLHPRDLDPSITARIPLRFNWDEKYVDKNYQVMPSNGYTSLMQNILDHQNIVISTNSVFDRDLYKKLKTDYNVIIYTGPIDSFFNYRYGKLDYRSLKFIFKTFNVPFKQDCVQINYPNEKKYTRTVEIKHVTKQNINKTTVSYEYPTQKGEPFYPILNQKSALIIPSYKKLVKKEEAKAIPTYFIGRLAEYRYFDMDQVFAKALNLSKVIEKRFR